MGGSKAKERRRQQRLHLQSQADKGKSQETGEITKGDKTSHNEPQNHSENKPYNNKRKRNATEQNRPSTEEMNTKKKDAPKKSREKKFKKPKHLKRKLQEATESNQSTIEENGKTKATTNDDIPDRKEKILQELKKWEIQKKAHLIQEKQLVQKKRASKRARREMSIRTKDEDDGVPKEKDDDFAKEKDDDVRKDKEDKALEAPNKIKDMTEEKERDPHSADKESIDGQMEDQAKNSTTTTNNCHSNSSSSDSDDSDSDEEENQQSLKRQRGKGRRGRRVTSEQQTAAAAKQDQMEKEQETTNAVVGEQEHAMENGPEDSSTKTKGPSKVQSPDERYCLGRKPVTDFTVGRTYTGKVVYIKPFGIFLDIGCHSDAFCHVSRLCDEYIKSPEERFHIGEELPNVRILEIDRSKKRITVSLQTMAMAEHEKASIESRKQRKERQRVKKKETSSAELRNEKMEVEKKETKQAEESNADGTSAQQQVEAKAQHHVTTNTNDFSEKPGMTPAELKRARKLARRAARRANKVEDETET